MQDNGTITVAGLIDYEVASSMTLWLQARDSEPQPLVAYKKVTVTVEDKNDNMPRFNTSFYETHFVENQPQGTKVMQVSDI